MSAHARDKTPRGGRFAEGAHFAVTIGLALALAALLCYVSTRTFVRMDWRSSAEQPLTADTLALLAHVKTPVQALIIHGPLFLDKANDKELYRALLICRQVLAQFRQACPSLSVSELDWSQASSQAPLRQVSKELGEKAPPMCVVFSAGGEHEEVSFSDFIYRAAGPFGPRDTFLGESAFAQAVAGLTGLQDLAPAPMSGGRRMRFFKLPAGRVVAARYAFVFGIPALFIVLGGIVWLVRRR